MQDFLNTLAKGLTIMFTDAGIVFALQATAFINSAMGYHQGANMKSIYDQHSRKTHHITSSGATQ
jgi:hypothetical protein